MPMSGVTVSHKGMWPSSFKTLLGGLLCLLLRALVDATVRVAI